MVSFEELIDGLPPVFRKGVAMYKRLRSGDSEQELTVKDLTATEVTTDALTSAEITANALATKTIQYDIDYVETGLEPVGTTYYDKANHTKKTILPYGSSLLDGQEMLEPVYNDSGADIPNGTAVYFGAPAGPDGHLSIELTRPDIFPRFAGLTTGDITDGAEGWVATYGVVHDMDITGLSLGGGAFADPAVPGGMTNTDPTWPDHIIFMGGVIKDNGDGTGDFRVDPYIVQREVPTPVVLQSYTALPARDAEENIHGGLFPVVAGHDLSAGDLTLTGATNWGIGKMLIVVNAGTDLVGDITVTGTQVDRDTGVETGGQASTITVDALTVDTSGTDTNGFSYNDLQHAYITDKWFSGATDIVITSGDTVLTDIDIYQVSFEQFNDAKYIGLVTADMNYIVEAVSPVSAYIYTVEVTDDVCDLTMRGSHVQSAAQQTAGRMYRIRRGNMGIELDGTTDGVFIAIRFAGINKFKDVGIKIWGNVLYN